MTKSGGTARAVRLAVMEIDGVWRLFLNEVCVGRFKERTHAVQCALDVARETRADGQAVEVLTHDRFGEIYSNVAHEPSASTAGQQVSA